MVLQQQICKIKTSTCTSSRARQRATWPEDSIEEAPAEGAAVAKIATNSQKLHAADIPAKMPPQNKPKSVKNGREIGVFDAEKYFATSVVASPWGTPGAGAPAADPEELEQLDLDAGDLPLSPLVNAAFAKPASHATWRREHWGAATAPASSTAARRAAPRGSGANSSNNNSASDFTSPRTSTASSVTSCEALNAEPIPVATPPPPRPPHQPSKYSKSKSKQPPSPSSRLVNFLSKFKLSSSGSTNTPATVASAAHGSHSQQPLKSPIIQHMKHASIHSAASSPGIPTPQPPVTPPLPAYSQAGSARAKHFPSNLQLPPIAKSESPRGILRAFSSSREPASTPHLPPVSTPASVCTTPSSAPGRASRLFSASNTPRSSGKPPSPKLPSFLSRKIMQKIYNKQGSGKHRDRNDSNLDMEDVDACSDVSSIPQYNSDTSSFYNEPVGVRRPHQSSSKLSVSSSKQKTTMTATMADGSFSNDNMNRQDIRLMAEIEKLVMAEQKKHADQKKVVNEDSTVPTTPSSGSAMAMRSSKVSDNHQYCKTVIPEEDIDDEIELAERLLKVVQDHQLASRLRSGMSYSNDNNLNYATNPSNYSNFNKNQYINSNASAKKSAASYGGPGAGAVGHSSQHRRVASGSYSNLGNKTNANYSVNSANYSNYQKQRVQSSCESDFMYDSDSSSDLFELESSSLSAGLYLRDLPVYEAKD